MTNEFIFERKDLEWKSVQNFYDTAVAMGLYRDGYEKHLEETVRGHTTLSSLSWIQARLSQADDIFESLVNRHKALL